MKKSDLIRVIDEKFRHANKMLSDIYINGVVIKNGDGQDESVELISMSYLMDSRMAVKTSIGNWYSINTLTIKELKEISDALDKKHSNCL